MFLIFHSLGFDEPTRSVPHTELTPVLAPASSLHKDQLSDLSKPLAALGPGHLALLLPLYLLQPTAGCPDGPPGKTTHLPEGNSLSLCGGVHRA